MTILGSIIDVLFNHPLAQSGESPAPATSVPESPAKSDASSPSTVKSSVNIEAIMNDLVAKRGEKLDWQHSAVDLLKALGLDSSRDARVRLAREMGYPGDLSLASSQLNEWVHDRILTEIEKNGGRLPSDLSGKAR
jgi:hypothetical protein